MKKHNTIKVVLCTTLIFLLLTWILPAAYYSGQYVDQGRVQMGLFDLFNYPLTALSYFGYIALFIILVGGFYGILYKIPAYRSFLDGIVKFFKGKETVALSIMVVLIAAMVSICGVHFALALFIPFVVALILLMGYDKIVAAFVTVGSIAVGLLGSTYAYNNTSVLTSSLALKGDFQIGVRFVILLVGIVLVIFNTLMYIKRNKTTVKVTVKDEVKEESVAVAVKETAKKVAPKKAPAKKTPAKKTATKKTTAKKTTKSSTRKSSNKAALMDEDVIVVPSKVSGSHKVWPLVVVFISLFVIYVLAFITWGESGFGIKFFDNVTKSVQEFELFKFPIFAKILGTFNSFGNWSLADLFLPMALSIVLLAIIYKVKLDDIFDGFAEGAKKALAPAFVAILLYSILVLVTYHPFQMVIYKAVLGLTKKFNIVTTAVVGILSAFFNSDMTYSFQSVIPYYVSLFPKADLALVGIIFQTMYGLTMLVAPTSLALMGVLAYLNVSYKEWLKNAWKLFLELFVVLLIIFIILAAL